MKKAQKFDKQAIKLVKLMIPGRGLQTLKAQEVVTIASQFRQSNQWSAVVALMKQVTTQLPAYLEPWLALLDALHHLGDFQQLGAEAQLCLTHKPRNVAVLLFLATAERLQQQHVQALLTLDRAQKLEPGNASLFNHKGIVHKELGELSAALEAFNRCIKLNSQFYEAYWNRSDLLTEPTDGDLSALKQQLERDGLSSTNRARLHYSLARAYEYRGEGAAQFHHVEMGAKAKREAIDYQHGKEIEQTHSIPRCFSPAVLSQKIDSRELITTPIFICGLPRSGTTLTEQILSSHPLVTAGDELLDLQIATSEQLRHIKCQQEFPEWGGDLTATDWRAIGDIYLSRTRALQKTPFFTDKNLLNYKAIGLIHLALPEAKIIYCQRDPMDNLWGCYRQLFGEGLYFTYSQSELADAWNEAHRLLKYWQEHLSDKLLVINYEELVDNQKAVTETLLEFVGLPWSEACMNFHQNSRAVRTTSSTQVRSALSNKRIGQWRAFESQLQPLYQRLQIHQHPTENQ